MNSEVRSVCYFGTYRSNYSRNQIMIEGLRRAGIEVIECHEPLWRGVEDRVQTTSGGWLKPSFWIRVLVTYCRLLHRYFEMGNYQVLVVGYPGQFDVFLARLLSWLSRKPMVWDVFMSIYLIAVERGLKGQHALTVNILSIIERVALHLPNMLILDTPEYVNWFQEKYGVSPERFKLVPTGADDRIYHPLNSKIKPDSKFRVIYYGTFIPNHGVEYIVQAARILENERDVVFELVGRGPEKPHTVAYVKKYNLKNVSFMDWLNASELIQHVAKADVCLGAFGVTPQSLMTVQNKIYEGMAMRKPIITGESPALLQTFEHGEHLFLCARADPNSLAQAILTLKDDPDLRRHLAQTSYHLFRSQFSLTHLGECFASHLKLLVSETH